VPYLPHPHPAPFRGGDRSRPSRLPCPRRPRQRGGLAAVRADGRLAHPKHDRARAAGPPTRRGGICQAQHVRRHPATASATPSPLFPHKSFAAFLRSFVASQRSRTLARTHRRASPADAPCTTSHFHAGRPPRPATHRPVAALCSAPPRPPSPLPTTAPEQAICRLVRLAAPMPERDPLLHPPPHPPPP
jgi:hypothetical protein